MATVHISASGPLLPDEAWERYARPALWSTWSPHIRRVDVRVARLSGGETGRVHGPLGLSVDFTVDAWDDVGRVWSWTVRPRLPRWPAGLIPRVQLTHGVESAKNGCRTWLRVSGPAPVIVGYLPVAGVALRRLVR